MSVGMVSYMLKDSESMTFHSGFDGSQDKKKVLICGTMVPSDQGKESKDQRTGKKNVKNVSWFDDMIISNATRNRDIKTLIGDYKNHRLKFWNLNLEKNTPQ